MSYEELEQKLNTAALTFARGIGRDEADKMSIYANYMAGGRWVLQTLKEIGVLK